MITPDSIYARAIARRVELRMELREIDTFLTVYRKLTNADEGLPTGGTVDQERREGCRTPEATPEGSVSSPAGETAATDPADYEALLDCWRSGQMSEAQLREHLNDAGFRLFCENIPDPDNAPYMPNDADDEAPTDPQPAAPDEATADPANRGGEDEVVPDDPHVHTERPVRDEPRPVAANVNSSLGIRGVYYDERYNRYRAQVRVGGVKHNLGSFATIDEAKAAYEQAAQEHQPKPGPKRGELRGGPQNFSGLSMDEKCDRLMKVLIEAAEDDGRVPLSNAQMGKRASIPEGSVYGTLSALRKRGLIRRYPGGHAYVIDHKPENTESREDKAAPTAEPEAVSQQAPARETAAPDPEAKAGADVSRDESTRSPDAARQVPDETEFVSRPAGGRSPAATSEQMNATSPGGEQPGTPSPILAEPKPRTQAPPAVPKQSDVAFDSTAPKPEWDFGKDSIIAQPASAVGAPDRLAVSGNYLLCGKHNVRLVKEQAIIVARLVKDWGSPVRREALAEELMSRSTTGLTAKAALAHTGLKPLGDLNAALKEAGLMVLEDEGKWKLMQRQEAGKVTA